MADKKMTVQNKNQILLDWFNNVGVTRTDTVYYRIADLNAVEIRQFAFDKGMLIKITPVDDFVGTITFDRILS